MPGPSLGERYVVGVNGREFESGVPNDPADWTGQIHLWTTGGTEEDKPGWRWPYLGRPPTAACGVERNDAFVTPVSRHFDSLQHLAAHPSFCTGCAEALSNDLNAPDDWADQTA